MSTLQRDSFKAALEARATRLRPVNDDDGPEQDDERRKKKKTRSGFGSEFPRRVRADARVDVPVPVLTASFRFKRLGESSGDLLAERLEGQPKLFERAGADPLFCAARIAGPLARIRTATYFREMPRGVCPIRK